jgi:Fe-S cluster assembly protein SufD
LVRQEIRVDAKGEGSEFKLRGVNLLAGDTHCDVTMMLDHSAPDTNSTEVIRNIVTDKAQGVFQGQIRVARDAQKTDAKMASHGLLLSEDAEVDHKPELEIFADDVQCGHGATAGDLDEDLLFYLKARGIPQKEAESLLIQAFVGDAIEGIEHAGLREALIEAVSGWLAARG